MNEGFQRERAGKMLNSAFTKGAFTIEKITAPNRGRKPA
jgi:hypothetical protein